MYLRALTIGELPNIKESKKTANGVLLSCKKNITKQLVKLRKSSDKQYDHAKAIRDLEKQQKAIQLIDGMPVIQAEEDFYVLQ